MRDGEGVWLDVGPRWRKGLIKNQRNLTELYIITQNQDDNDIGT